MQGLFQRATPRERLIGIAYMAAGVFVFAIMDSLMKRLSNHYAPFQVSFLRSVSSWLLLLAPIAWRRSWQSIRLSNAPLHLFRGLLGISMLGSFVYAVHRLSLAQTYSLFLCAPLLMTALSVPLHGERVPARRWAAIVFGLSGVLVILHPWGSSNGYTLGAALAAAAATVSYCLSALSVRNLGRTNTSMSMVFWYLAFVSLGSGLLAAWDWRPIPLTDWGWLVAVGVTGALGQMWLTEAFRRAPPSVVAPFEYTSILWAFAIDWIFWSAKPSLSLVVGAGIVVVSGIAVILDERLLNRPAVEPASPPP